jgi:hypothetical protein
VAGRAYNPRIVTSRRLACVFSLLSWAAPVLLPFAAGATPGGHGCSEEVCRCAHRAPAPPAEAPCHGHEAAPVDCQMSATCNHELTMALVTAPLYEAPVATSVESPLPDATSLAAADPAAVRHGFARLDPHPPPAL